MCDIRKMIASSKYILFDGAMGTQLQLKGLLPGESPEAFCLQNMQILEGIHAEYVQAGANVITTNTFGGSRFKLPDGLAPYDFNKKMAQAAKRVTAKAGTPAFVAGSIGPTGQLLQPLGDIDFATLVDAFQEQIQGLVDGGVDLLIAETHYDVAEARAIVIAARKVCSLPIAVSMTYEDNRTLTGSNVAVCIATFENMGVDLIGLNCSGGPAEMAEAVETLLAHCSVPILVQPNAGLPYLENDQTVFPLGVTEFANLVGAFAVKGVQCVGGCCGTSPAHIAALRQKIDILPIVPKRPQRKGIVLTSRAGLVRIGGDAPFCAIGERINPTGKKKLTAALQAGELDLALQYADEQIFAGANLLDVNVGAPLIDETLLLPQLVATLAGAVSTPLCIDSSNTDAVVAALCAYPASALVNSISGEHGRMETLGPICRDFGAPFVLLPLQGNDLPVTAQERIQIIDSLLEKMDDLHIPRYLAMVDVLVLTLSSSPFAAQECLEVIRYCRKLGLPTVCGLSNISFGLPARDMLNAHFLSMAVGAGLDAAIINPSSPRVAESLRTAQLLQGFDEGAETFIENYSTWQHGGASGTASAGGSISAGNTTAEKPSLKSATDELHKNPRGVLNDGVVRGNKTMALEALKILLEQKADPFTLVNETLIPAIGKVGDLYEKKEYFLPQLIRSAETMQSAFAKLRPLLVASEQEQKKPVIILATVEGDIHDIGKNIVHLLLSNHGFEVVDLGKNVKAIDIVVAAREHKAALIGLSALMTTTIVRMGETVNLLKEEQLDIKVLVGGAVVTESFATSIGAYYSKDAVGAVRLAQSFV